MNLNKEIHRYAVLSSIFFSIHPHNLAKIKKSLIFKSSRMHLYPQRSLALQRGGFIYSKFQAGPDLSGCLNKATSAFKCFSSQTDFSPGVHNASSEPDFPLKRALFLSVSTHRFVLAVNRLRHTLCVSFCRRFSAAGCRG